MAVTEARLWPFETAHYRKHDLHGADRAWPETNCYVDLWIEVLHTLKLDPRACLAFTLAGDWEGDQWTFVKPPHADLLSLYGIDVQELAVWRPMVAHVLEQVQLGRLVVAEADAFFMPDTASTDYRVQHTKTTIAIQEIDVTGKRLGYFHNAGYFTLSGDDFDGVLAAQTLPLFAEFARLDRLVRHEPAALATLAQHSMQAHLARLPKSNPLRRFQERFVADLPWLIQQDLALWHQYAFATLRQLGACFELAASFTRWLEAHGNPKLASAARDFDLISTTAKAMVLKGARAVNAKRPSDFSEPLSAMTSAWDRAFSLLLEGGSWSQVVAS